MTICTVTSSGEDTDDFIYKSEDDFLHFTCQQINRLF